jgi:hypothetical protein
MTGHVQVSTHDDLDILWRKVIDVLDELIDLTDAALVPRADPLLAPDLDPLRADLRNLALALGIVHPEVLELAIRNVEEYLADEPGAARHHLLVLRRRLVFQRWPEARKIWELVHDVRLTERLLTEHPTEQVRTIVEDILLSPMFRRVVKEADRPRVVAQCIERGVLFSESPELAGVSAPR